MLGKSNDRGRLKTNKLESAARNRFEFFSLGLMLIVSASYWWLTGATYSADKILYFAVFITAFIGALIIVGVFVKPSNATDHPNQSLNVSTWPLQANPPIEIEKMLWDWARGLDLAVVDEFGVTIIGIGALFFAFGTVRGPHTKLLIAILGMAASLILWLHLYALRQDFDRIKTRGLSDAFLQKIGSIQKWRSEGVNRILYYPVGRLITYFMGFVAWVWFLIILSQTGSPFPILLWSGVSLFIPTLALFIFRRYQDLHRKHLSTT